MDRIRSEAVTRFAAALATRRDLMRAIFAVVAAGSGNAAGGAAIASSRRRHRKRRQRQRRRDRGDRPRGGPQCDVCEDAGRCAFASIQAAVRAATAQNPTIRVCPGTYEETVVVDRPVSLLGVPVAGERPTIDARGHGTTVTVNTGVTALMTNFTITGGEAGAGGGIVNRGTLRLQGCEVSGNDATGQTFGTGGGILNTQQGILVAADTIVTKNRAKADGGQGGGIFNDHGRVTLSECLVSENDAKLFGGGIANAGGTLILQATRVTKNDADNGGGLFNEAAGQVAVVEGSRVFANDPNNCVGTNACGS